MDDLSNFLGKSVFGDDGFGNIFVYQPTLDTLKIKKDKSTDYNLSQKSKEVFTPKLKQLYITFLHSINSSRYRMQIKLNKDLLTVQQNSYPTKIVNSYIVYYLDAFPKIPLENFKLKNCWFGAHSIKKQ